MKRVKPGHIALGIVLAIGTWLALPSPSPPDPAGGTVRILRDSSEAEITGPLATALARPLRVALANGARTVQLDSTGGSQAAAESLAAEIKAAGASTAVTDRCLSACVAVFLAGRQRWLGPYAQLALEARHAGTSLLGLYRRTGVSSNLLPDVAATPDGEGWFPTTSDLLANGMATGLAAADQFALAGFGPNPSVESIRTRLLSVPLYRAVAAADPAAFETDLVAWNTAVLQGQPGTRAFNATRSTVRDLVRQALPNAPDDMLLAHAGVLMAEIAWVRAHRPELCANIEADALPELIEDFDLAARRGAVSLSLVRHLGAVQPRTVSSPPSKHNVVVGCQSLELALVEAQQDRAALRALAMRL